MYFSGHSEKRLKCEWGGETHFLLPKLELYDCHIVLITEVTLWGGKSCSSVDLQ